MFSGGMVSGPLLIGIFILAIVVLLLLIIKFKLNAFVALLLTAFGTGVLVNMPLPDVASTVTDGFGSTLGSIGMVTGLGVMLGKFMFESGGIESISNGILGIFGEKNHRLLWQFQDLLPVFRCLEMWCTLCLHRCFGYCPKKQAFPWLPFPVRFRWQRPVLLRWYFRQPRL